MAKNNKFTWCFDQPVHREDKKEIPGIRPEFKGECLDEQLDRILEGTTVEELFSSVPSRIRVGDKIARLEILKGSPGSRVWQARYFTYEGPENLIKHTVLYQNAPDLRLALYLLSQEVNSKYSDFIISEDKQADVLDKPGLTVKELLDALPPMIKGYSGVDTMRLRVSKGYSGKIWYAGYYTYIDAPGRDFQQTYVEKVTESDLQVALATLLEKIKKYIKDESD